MIKLTAKNIDLAIDEKCGAVESLKILGKEALADKLSLFALRFRDLNGGAIRTESFDAKSVIFGEGVAEFSRFGGVLDDVCVKVYFCSTGKEIRWGAEVGGVPSELALEYIELPRICLPRLVDNNDSGGKILFPYDEGILLTDETLLPRYEPEFPMSGAYFIFPNKICSQFISYHFDSFGLYIGAHDEKRAFKGIDFYPCGSGVCMTMRLYSGRDYGECFKTEYPIVWRACTEKWQSAAEIYRAWFEKNLPHTVVKTQENNKHPAWYKNMPLIVTYPVRGIHDMDKMEPNALFPYTNALPILNKIKRDTGSTIMSLLMHWEGTAPWAPPYMWPPFGGVDCFNEFRDALHKSGDLLGVYCSGFGYTQRSTLIESYNLEEKIKNEDVLSGVCHSPANKPELGRTCTPYQRYGYDICPASDRGREILNEGFTPLFESGVDYAQILDQNHGGGQYMCFAREHNHPPMPGEWMTSNMQELLGEWQEKAPNMLFGCESAAAEPFIGGLLMSDNRYELNYPFGTPVPAFAYVYHEYLRNFMGNQCGCPFEPSVDTLRYRLAYSFSIGDLMTLTLSPSGDLMTHWGTHDFSCPPDFDKTMTFIRNVMRFYREIGREYLYSGKMKNAPEIECEQITLPLFRGRKEATLPRLLSSAWEAEGGKTAYVVVNPEDAWVGFTVDGKKYECAPLDAMLILK